MPSTGRSADADAARLVVLPGTRAVFISPHPDDAVLGAGGLIQRIVERGGSVEIVEVTSGDGFSRGVMALRRMARSSPTDYRQYGSLREREVVRAMSRIGIHRSRIRLLGFPDDGLCELASDRIPSSIFASPYTGRDSPPYPERMVPDVKYRGEDVRQELARILLAFRPTLVVMPDSHDEHPDHCATHALAHGALASIVAGGLRAPDVLHYLIHYRGWPDPSGSPPPRDGTRQVLTLTARERTGKRRAIDAYRSQLTVMADFLHAFNGPQEEFARGDSAPVAPCWCHGENVISPSRRGQ